MRHSVYLLLIVLLVVNVAPATASSGDEYQWDVAEAEKLADDLDGPNAKEIWNSLTQEQQEAFLEGIAISEEFEVSKRDYLVPASMSQACGPGEQHRVAEYSVDASTVLGFDAYTYQQNKEYCYDWQAGTVSVVNFYHWLPSSAGTFEWNGHASGSPQSTYIDPGHHWSQTQGEIENCVFDFCQYFYPWVEIDAYSSGTWTADGNPGA